ncbi:MAG: hypothetical protein HOP33_06580 [Verrucomicrobia bacterium]|nr:hypothetical protein [Verrucomicrobiota bacterium]
MRSLQTKCATRTFPIIQGDAPVGRRWPNTLAELGVPARGRVIRVGVWQEDCWGIGIRASRVSSFIRQTDNGSR